MTQKRVVMTEANRKENQPYDIDVIPPDVHMTKGIKFVNYLAGISLLIIAIAISIFIKWSVADTNVLTIKNNPFPVSIVSDPTGKTGGIVVLTADYCKNTHDIGSVRMSYVSASREVLVPTVDEQLYVGCRKANIPVVIPLNLTQDKYRIVFNVTYDINPIKRNIVVNFESQQFVVGSNITATQ